MQCHRSAGPLDKSLSAPVSLGGLFGPDSSDDEGGSGFDNSAQESQVQLGGVSLRLLERPFHPLNANAFLNAETDMRHVKLSLLKSRKTSAAVTRSTLEPVTS